MSTQTCRLRNAQPAKAEQALSTAALRWVGRPTLRTTLLEDPSGRGRLGSVRVTAKRDRASEHTRRSEEDLQRGLWES
jgi:hypothetical protein